MIMTSRIHYDAEIRIKNRGHKTQENWTCGQGEWSIWEGDFKIIGTICSDRLFRPTVSSGVNTNFKKLNLHYTRGITSKRATRSISAA